MATKTKTEEKYAIPAEHLDEIKALEKAYTEADIMADCCKARYKNAMKAGDAPTAILEKQNLKDLAQDSKAAHEAMWGRIHEIIPDLDKEDPWTLDTTDWVVEMSSRGGNGLAGLARMLGNRDED